MRALNALAVLPRPRAPWVRRPWAAAAAVLLALGLGFAMGRIPASPVPDPALREAQERAARLETELQRLRAEPRQEAVEPRTTSDRQIPAKAAAPRPLTNLPFVWLGPAEALRGPGPIVKVAPEAVWSGRGLVKTGVSELAIALPRTLLPAGDYALRLYDDEPGVREACAEYALRVERGGPSADPAAASGH